MTSLAPGTFSARATTNFATNLYGPMAAQNPGKNVGYSPINIAHAMALTAEAAGGTTRDEIYQTLGLPSATERQDLARCLKMLPSFAGTSGKISLASNIWTAIGLPVSETFKKTVSAMFGPAHEAIDFLRNAEGARSRINQVVSLATNGLIPKLLEQGTVNAGTQMVLTTAIYLKMDWASQFKKDLTKAGAFTLLDGAQVQAPLMNKYREELPYFHDEELGVQVLELPYKDSSLSFVAMLPDATDGLADLEAHLTPENLEKWFNGLKYGQGTKTGRVALPKFDIATEYKLGQVLKALGIKEAFGAADFSGLDPSIARGQLQISEVIHKAVVKVNEEGSEAAAATGVVMRSTSIGPPPVNFIADHPFVWAIRDKTTGHVLFLGRIADPTKP